MTANNNQKVAVVGGGVIGVMAAWQLAKRGHNVTVYDQWNTPNDRGASAGESAFSVPLTRKARTMFRSCRSPYHCGRNCRQVVTFLF